MLTSVTRLMLVLGTSCQDERGCSPMEPMSPETLTFPAGSPATRLPGVKAMTQGRLEEGSGGAGLPGVLWKTDL